MRDHAAASSSPARGALIGLVVALALLVAAPSAWGVVVHLRNGAGSPAYSASKAGVISLVSLAANNLAGTNVRVNGICPGLIETGMTKPIFDRAREKGTDDKIGQLNALRRAGQPEEIAKVALFLASDDASYVNGQVLPVDGGLSSSLPVVPPRSKG